MEAGFETVSRTCSNRRRRSATVRPQRSNDGDAVGGFVGFTGIAIVGTGVGCTTTGGVVGGDGVGTTVFGRSVPSNGGAVVGA